MNRKTIYSVVCYNNEEEVVKFGSQLINAEEHEVVLLVTCNECHNQAYLENALRDLPIITHIYYSDKNLGYLHGCLNGIKNYGLKSKDDWIIISNTDVEYNAIDVAETIDRISNICDVWGVGPDICIENGYKQNPFMEKRISRKEFQKLLFIHSHSFIINLYTSMSYAKKTIVGKKTIDDLKERYVYAIHGSFMIIKAEFIEKIIENCDNIFLYGEELLVAELAVENNKKMLYAPRIKILHKENASTGLINMKMKKKWFCESYQYLLQRFSFGEE